MKVFPDISIRHCISAEKIQPPCAAFSPVAAILKDGPLTWNLMPTDTQMPTRTVNLNLYCLLDIGIHYHGWDLSQLTRYVRLFGITEEDVIQEIYQYIVETPANYLRYYVGYLGFYDLKNAASQKEGDAFDLKEFHRKVLEIGPVPFPILQKYLNLASEEK